MSKLVHIIILNWNRAHDTMQCVKSCNELHYSNYRILVVDNGSTDNSEGLLRDAFPGLEILQAGKNLGFAGGNNIGIRHALERGADYIWLLNNDTVVDATCLDYLVRAAEAEETRGMVGNKIYYHHAPETIWYAGGTVDLERGGLTSHAGKDLRDDGSYDKPGPAGYITGCSLLARKETIQDIGLLDDNYFLYFEDVDWSLRAKEKGWTLFFEPQAKLWHKEGAQREQGYSDTFIYYSVRNRLYFMKRFAPHRMLRCHLLQLRTMLFFMKTAFHQGLIAGLRPLKLAALGYADFYFSKKMGMRHKL